MNMKVRPLKQSDIGPLKFFAECTGYPYPDLASPLIEDVLVVADDEDRPVVAIAAERIVQLYMFCAPGLTAGEKMRALRSLHECMEPILRLKGYREANAFLPRIIAEKFGRRLVKSFGWAENWRSWCKTF